MKSRKMICFWTFAALTGALIFGAPVLAKGQKQEEVDHSGEGQISKPSYLTEGIDSSEFADDSTVNSYGYYSIMGATTVTQEEMVAMYNNQGVTYPSETLEGGGAPDIETFCEIITEEAAAEEVRAEVVFVQSMLETGWLQYQGDSSAEQFNFAGLGTTGDGVEGISFPDVRTGLRAQVQHLKAYASSSDLNQLCVDERFDLVQRETAPYVEWLGIQENPYGVGWAEGADYGSKLRNLLTELKGEVFS